MADKPRQKKWEAEMQKEFLAAYDEYADAIFRHCLIRLRDREVATDVTQETFSKAWLYMAEGNKVEYLRAFLYRIANNLIVDTVRKRRTTSLDAMIEDDGFEVKDESIREPIDKPAIQEAMQMLKSLDEIYRTAITMRYIDEMSPREIAKALDVSENVVSVRIHRGIQRLAKLMQQKGVNMLLA